MGSRVEQDGLIILRMAASRCWRLEDELAMARKERDREALQAVDRGVTWRAVADAAGFANPYIAHLKRKRAAAAGLVDQRSGQG